MNIKQCGVFLLVFWGSILSMQAQSFDNLWKQVKQAEEKSLPETVVKLTNEIYRKGMAEKNSPQMLKAYMWNMKCREMLTPDSFYVSLKGLERWAKETDKPMDRVVLHSLIAEIYADYAAGNQWQLRKITDIEGEAPSADIREWTANMFVEKVRDNVKEALADSALLLATSSQTYVPFVELGDAGEYFHHDMYHLLASRAVTALEQIESLERNGSQEAARSSVKQDIMDIYKSMLAAYKAAGRKEGYILTAIDYWKWYHRTDKEQMPFGIRDAYAGTVANDSFPAGLSALKDEFVSDPIVAEVYLVEAQHAVERGRPADGLKICDEAIRRYPDYRGINAVKNLRQRILTPALRVSTEKQVFPDEEIELRVWHKNLDGFTVRLYQAKKLVRETHYALRRPEDYLEQDTAFTFKAPGLGAYVMRIVPDSRARDNDDESEMCVTRIKMLTCSLPGDLYEVVALNGKTGHPIPHAKVTLYDSEGKVLKEHTTGENGKVSFPWSSDYNYAKVSQGADTAMAKQYIHRGVGYYGDRVKERQGVSLLTDRSLYRPGQTVHVKGVAYVQRADTADVLPDKNYTVLLYDANAQEIGKQKVRTNEFGSFTADFVLPSACLNGVFYLRVVENSSQINDSRISGYQTIRVEEYKRPTFDLTFDKQERGYRLGDEVRVKGKVQSYSGVALQDIPVKYKVRRSVYSFWRMSESSQIASGEVAVDENGEFMIPVLLEEHDAYKDNEKIHYRYTVEAIATNVAGETQSSTYTLAAGSRSLVLQPDIQKGTCKDKPVGIVFKVSNLNETPVSVEGSYALYPASEKEFKVSPDVAAVATGTFTSNEEMKLDWKHLPSGAYVLKASVRDDEGKEVTSESKTVLFSWDDKRPPVRSKECYYAPNTEFDAAHPAEFLFGTSEKDAYVMMDVLSNDKLLESKALHMSDTIVRFTYPYKESYGDGLLVNFCLVRDGKVYQRQIGLRKRMPEKKLKMKWEVFRDKLRPGQQEEWKLTVKTPCGQAADAEMLAMMYDASLDKLWNRQQNLTLNYQRIIPRFNWRDGDPGYNFFRHWWDNKWLKEPDMLYDRFMFRTLMHVDNLLCVVDESEVETGAGVRTAKRAQKKAEPAEFWIRGTANASPMASMKVADEKVALTGAIAPAALPEASAELRTNLTETAFFYPHLRTNEQGEISFSFIMPESLTRWNFRGYAHTKGMLTGTLDGEVTTSKEFMLTPNMPRFVRVGDKTTIAASISNMTGKPQAGAVSMILFDPMTEKVIDTQKQKFSIAAGKTVGVDFRFTVGDKYEVLGCRMVADSEAFSDGEQQLIPVLGNKEHLVETLPMPMRGEETRTFSLDALFNRHSKTATDRKLTIEFTGNPAWYAVQALPSLGTPVNDNAISWATAYYANALASFVMNSQPRIKAVFDSWKLQGGTKETFLNNLQKNQELKNILLSESPWVLEAQTEKQQKERIAILFDLNNIRSNNITALTRLQELQNSSGAWTWCKGMGSSDYVTAYIAELNARLALLTGEKLSGTALTLQTKALAYLHQSALKEYKHILKAQKEGAKFTGISDGILQYLYILAISGEEVPASNKAAYTYFLSKVGELLSSSSSMSVKAAAAVVLYRAGDKRKSDEFVASLKEHLAKSDELGMYFDFNDNPYAWNGMKLRTHVNVMEALSLVGGHSAVVEEMKLWLLKQKQTQQWSSPVASADAVYALLMNGADLLNNQGDVRVVIADEVLETVSPSKTTVPELGYVKRSFTAKSVVDARKVEVEKRNPGIAWGAVYAEYDSPIADVEQHGGELKVRKELYVERTSGSVTKLEPITDNTLLNVGDKVVCRLSIRVGRAMDFLQLKDQRGACFEPMGNLSGYHWNGGLGYYVDVKDASIHFFFDHLEKGLYILEHSCRVSRAGSYATGLATLQCAYAPEYASHSSSTTVTVE